MSCCDANKNVTIYKCDDHTGDRALVFVQSDKPWPAGASDVRLRLCYPSCGLNGQIEIKGEYISGNPNKAVFALPSRITCALPCGHRTVDYRIIAIATADDLTGWGEDWGNFWGGGGWSSEVSVGDQRTLLTGCISVK